MKRWILVTFFMMFCAPVFSAGQITHVEIVDSATGRILPVYHSSGRHYVAGAPGWEYSIRLRNRAYQELLAVVSVDGVNVVTGESAAVDQGGYILQRRQRFDIRGWRKSLDQVAAFYFSPISESYAAQTGRPHDVGVIGVALFKRMVYPAELELRSEAQKSGRARAPAAASADARSLSDAQESVGKLDDSRLGTGHGRKQTSVVRYAQFERASEIPHETITIYYDSRVNLIARGIIPGKRSLPNPFPVGFVPDPPNC